MHTCSVATTAITAIAASTAATVDPVTWVRASADTEVAPPVAKLDEGDHDRFSHYVIGGGEALMRSAITGEPVVALCGKVWVPSRDPKKYPVCPECEEVQANRDENLIDR